MQFLQDRVIYVRVRVASGGLAILSSAKVGRREEETEEQAFLISDN